MEIKTSIQGWLIYITMVFYFCAAAGYLINSLRKKESGTVEILSSLLYFLGFITACLSVGYRSYKTGHIPMQNLFEVFLVLGVLVYPISMFCRGFLGIGLIWADLIIGLLVLFPAGFVFSEKVSKLAPALQSPFFGPHVAAYMLGYIFHTKGAIQAGMRLAGKVRPSDVSLLSYESASYRLTKIGFPFLTLGLILGAVWAQRAWGRYWGWDPKEMWSLATWLIFVFYFHFRIVYKQTKPKVSAFILILGFAGIITTLLWVNLSRLFPGLHSYAF